MNLELSLKRSSKSQIKFKNEQSVKLNVLEALKEENQKIGQDEVDKRMKAETKKPRPFSQIGTKDKKIVAKTSKPNMPDVSLNAKINYEVDDTSSHTDFERQEQNTDLSSISEYPKGSQPSLDTQMRKTDIIRKIEKLNETQRQQLIYLLDQMERGEAIDQIDLKFLSPKPTMAKSKHSQSSEFTSKLISERTNKHELRIRVLSTWGHIQLGGLTEIELFDI